MRIEIPFDGGTDVREELIEIFAREVRAILYAETGGESTTSSLTGIGRKPQTTRKPQQKHARPSGLPVPTAVNQPDMGAIHAQAKRE
jgi:hypothetical protein